MTKFLVCPRRCKESGVPYCNETPKPLMPHVNIDWCRAKCPHYDECEAREQFEVNLELEAETTEMEIQAYEQMKLRYMRL